MEKIIINPEMLNMNESVLYFPPHHWNKTFISTDIFRKLYFFAQKL